MTDYIHDSHYEAGEGRDDFRDVYRHIQCQLDHLDVSKRFGWQSAPPTDSGWWFGSVQKAVTHYRGASVKTANLPDHPPLDLATGNVAAARWPPVTLFRRAT